VIIASLLALALVAACGDDADGSAGGTTGTGKADQSADAECAVGTWRVDQGDLEAMVAIQAEVNGSIEFEFAKGGDFDSTWDYTARGTGEIKEEIVSFTTMKGTWSGPDDAILITFTQIQGQITTTTEDGQTTTEDVDDDADLVNDSTVRTATCSGSTMTVAWDAQPGSPNEQLTLTRQ